MKYIKKIGLILFSLFILLLGCIGTILISVLSSMGIEQILEQSGYGTTEFIMFVIFSACTLVCALISSIPIWSIPFKDEKDRLIRQIITTLIYICISILVCVATLGLF